MWMEHNKQDHAEARQGGGVRLQTHDSQGKPKKAALVLTDDDRAALFSLPDDKRAMVEDMMRRHAGLTAAEVLQALPETGM